MTKDIVVLAERKLLAGANVTRVQTLVSAALLLLEDVEAYAILSAAGDRAADPAIEWSIRKLESLLSDLIELPG